MRYKSTVHKYLPVSRRSLLGGTGVAVAAATLVGRATDRAAATDRPPLTFYVDPAGVDDDTKGTSPGAALRTVGFVNGCLVRGIIRHGDTVLFKGGAWFAGGLTPPEPVDASGPVLTFGAYGSGKPPTLSALKNAARWHREGPDLWSIDLRPGSGDFTFNESSSATDVGFLRVDGETFASRHDALDALVDQWDFATIGSSLFLRSDIDPNGKAIGLAVDEKLVAARSALVVEGLSLIGTGSHAFQTGRGVKNVTLRDCTIDLVGGSLLSGSASRYGNGVEVWIGGEDVVVENNTISRCYDTATTLQGSQEGAGRGWRNVTIRGNRISDCTQSFEHWSTGTDLGSGSGAAGCRFEANVCTGAGRGWGARARPDKAGKSTHLLFYAVDLPVDLEVTRNVFTDAAQCYCFFGVAVPPRLVSDRNTIRLTPATRLQWQASETIGEAASWSARTHLEESSSWEAL
jgi:hypothetical protein